MKRQKREDEQMRSKKNREQRSIDCLIDFHFKLFFLSPLPYSLSLSCTRSLSLTSLILFPSRLYGIPFLFFSFFCLVGNRLLRPILLLGSVLSFIFTLLRRCTTVGISHSLQCSTLGSHLRFALVYCRCSCDLRMALAIWP